jgi:hypothetical protein
VRARGWGVEGRVWQRVRCARGVHGGGGGGGGVYASARELTPTELCTSPNRATRAASCSSNRSMVLSRTATSVRLDTLDSGIWGWDNQRGGQEVRACVSEQDVCAGGPQTTSAEGRW